MIKSICILGGGTSGLIAALILKKWYPNIDITIVESSNVGIVGVGEGSTEHWATFMKTVGIDLQELITETGATFKSGIKFDNWNGDGKFYMHSLHADHTQVMGNGLPGVLVKLICDGVTHLYPDNIGKSIHFMPLESSVHQYHFDTHKLNNFLHNVCNKRDIKVIIDDIVSVNIDDAGFVSSLSNAAGHQYSAEFFIDCSGFSRVISSKLGAKWINCKEFLPMDRAIAFPSAYEEDIPSHTLSRALSSGWQWRIPTQERYGNGYVFSSDFLTEEQAIAEVQQYYPDEINVGKSFKFNTGYVDKFWIKNCVTIGLAGSFVEPLEASSIGTSIQQSFALGNALLSWSREDETVSKHYNREFEAVAKNIIDFVQLHYITKRNDTEFWRSCKNLKLTDFNAETLEHFKGVVPSATHFAKSWTLFTELNWIQVMAGLELFDLEKLRKIWNDQHPLALQETEEIIKHMDIQQRDFLAFSHRDALTFLSRNNKTL